uniref:Solute carrier family 35 member F1 n=1 Tax=Vitis vinifera TaxID=29760 RepID=F6HKJ7_VITVI
MQEFCVKKKDRVELMSMLGLFGLLVSVCEISIVELKSLESIEWSTKIVLAFVGFALSNFLFYTLVPFLLKISGATMFNLSALTSDMWAVVIRIFFYRQKVDWLYYLSFAVVAIGIIIYSTTEKDPIPSPSPEDGNLSAQYQVLNGESTESRNAIPGS